MAICTSPIIHLVCLQGFAQPSFQVLLGIAVFPGETEDDAYAQFWGKQGVLWEKCEFGHQINSYNKYLNNSKLSVIQYFSQKTLK